MAAHPRSRSVDAIDAIADLVAERLAARQLAAEARHEDATKRDEWTDRLAATLHAIKLEQLAQANGTDDAVGHRRDP